MAIGGLKPVLAKVVQHGNELQRFRQQSDAVLEKVRTATPEDLTALAKFVGSTELGRGLGLDIDPSKPLTPAAYLGLMHAVMSAKPTAEEQKATESIIKTAGAMPAALDRIEAGQATLEDAMTVKAGMRELFAQDAVLVKNGGVGLLDADDRKALVQANRDLAGLYDRANAQLARFTRGETPLKDFSAESIFHSQMFGPDLTLTQLFTTFGEQTRNSALQMPEGNSWREKDLVKAKVFEDIATALPDLSVTQTIELIARRAEDGTFNGYTSELMTSISNRLKLGLWSPPDA